MWVDNGDGTYQHKVYPEWEIHNINDGVHFQLHNTSTGEIIEPLDDMMHSKQFVVHVADGWLQEFREHFDM